MNRDGSQPILGKASQQLTLPQLGQADSYYTPPAYAPRWMGHQDLLTFRLEHHQDIHFQRPATLELRGGSSILAAAQGQGHGHFNLPDQSGWPHAGEPCPAAAAAPLKQVDHSAVGL